MRTTSIYGLEIHPTQEARELNVMTGGTVGWFTYLTGGFVRGVGNGTAVLRPAAAVDMAVAAAAVVDAVDVAAVAETVPDIAAAVVVTAFIATPKPAFRRLPCALETFRTLYLHGGYPRRDKGRGGTIVSLLNR